MTSQSSVWCTCLKNFKVEEGSLGMPKQLIPWPAWGQRETHMGRISSLQGKMGQKNCKRKLPRVFFILKQIYAFHLTLLFKKQTTTATTTNKSLSQTFGHFPQHNQSSRTASQCAKWIQMCHLYSLDHWPLFKSGHKNGLHLVIFFPETPALGSRNKIVD